MSLEDFQLIDNEPIDNSIKKRDFMKVYQQSGAKLNDSNQNIDFLFVENNNYYQIGNEYLEFDITFRDTAGNFTDASVIRLVNNAFAFCFKQATLVTTGGMDLEDIKYVGQVSTILRLLTSKDSDLSSCFDKNAEKPLNNDNLLKQSLINNHAEDVNKGELKGQLPLEHIIGFFKSFTKTTKNLGFHLIFKTNRLQDIILTTIVTDIKVTVNSLILYVPILIPNSQTHVMFNEAILNNYTFTLYSWYTERKISNDGRQLQVDIASAQHINSPNYLKSTFQTNDRTTPKKARNPSVCNTNHVIKYFVEIDGVRYNKNGVLTNFVENSYLGQYRYLKLFYKEYVGEKLLQPFIS